VLAGAELWKIRWLRTPNVRCEGKAVIAERTSDAMCQNQTQRLGLESHELGQLSTADKVRLQAASERAARQQTALNPLTSARFASSSLTQAYSPVLALAPTQIIQQENKIAVAPWRSRATATIWGK
jgi:hypothetical protein